MLSLYKTHHSLSALRIIGQYFSTSLGDILNGKKPDKQTRKHGIK
jgi:hypothetical protein